MNQYIPQILSDTTFERVELTYHSLVIKGTLYTEDEILLEFIGTEACYINPRWNMPDFIGGVRVSRESKLLAETIPVLKKYNLSFEELFSFQATGPFNAIVIEVIARSIKINGEPINIFTLTE